MMEDNEKARIAPYVTNLEEPVFCLKGLPEEVIAVLFAYYSRSRDDLRTNLARLLADQELAVSGAANMAKLEFAENKAKDFHEKWVVGYGHSSVAEHAVAHIALEKVSIVASKIIEDARLAAYTEKSTRYVVFDQDSFVSLDNALPESLSKIYTQTARELLELYLKLYEPVVARFKEKIAPKEKQAPRAYEAAIRAQACDVLRYLLPAGTCTNLGMTINGRALEHLLRKMYGTPLLEIQTLAKALHRESLSVLPTLVKYVEPSPHRMDVNTRIEPFLSAVLRNPTLRTQSTAFDDVRLIHFDENALDRVVAAIVYEQGSSDMTSVTQAVQATSLHVKNQIWSAYVDNRGRFDAPLRALEHTSYTLDVLLDQGAFRDLQRHRMQSQAIQRLGFEHGYELPETVSMLGIEDDMRRAIDRAQSTWTELAKTSPEYAQYIVPMAARRRYAVTMNLREAFHLIELRSSPHGHASYRRIAQQVWKAIENVHPWAAQHIRVNMQSYELSRS